jgi:tRNA threonylcarbamoyladenosine biosynthesis protein TsaB
MPSLLVFDASGERLAAALVVPSGAFLDEGPGGVHASTLLVPMLRGLLDAAGMTLAGLQAIGFGRGPGAFTGVRTACAVAQGLARGAGVPVWPFDTLEAVAFDARRRAGGVDADELWVAQDARMSEIYAACYAFDAAGGSRCVREPALYTLDALQAAWAARPPAWVAGSAVEAFADRLDWHGARLDAQAGPGALALAGLARARIGAAVLVDPAEAHPLYLRDKVALTTREREQLAATVR